MNTEQKTSERVFVGIKVSTEVAQAFAEFQRDLAGFPARLIRPTVMHLTLVPPWNTTDRASVENMLREALRGKIRFSILFEYVEYGPTMHRPRLVWAAGAPSEELTDLKKVLASTFGVKDEHPSFIPHVTIARFSEHDRIVFKHHPIAREIALLMPVQSVELFLSPPHVGKSYEVLTSVPLQ
jgi:2'-5' RNA ligase